MSRPLLNALVQFVSLSMTLRLVGKLAKLFPYSAALSR